MEHRKPMALALALAWGAAGTSHAQTSTDLDQIRQEIQAIKQDYEKRIQDLENRLKQAEQGAQQAQASAQRAAEQAQASAQRVEEQTQAAAAQPAPAAAGAAAQNAFNPGISLILQGAYQQYGTDPSTRSVTGYLPSGTYLEGNKGFNLNETELSLSANVDQLFYGQATFSFADGAVGTEEAFVSDARARSRADAQGAALLLRHRLRELGARARVGLRRPRAGAADVPGIRTSPSTAFKRAGSRRCPSIWNSARSSGTPWSFRSTDTSSKNGFSTGTLFGQIGGDIGTSHSYLVGAWLLNSQNLVDGASTLDLDDRTGVSNTLSAATPTSGAWTSSTSGRPTATRPSATSSWSPNGCSAS